MRIWGVLLIGRPISDASLHDNERRLASFSTGHRDTLIDCRYVVSVSDGQHVPTECLKSILDIFLED